MVVVVGVLLVAIVAIALGVALSQSGGPKTSEEKARDILKRVPLVDGYVHIRGSRISQRNKR